MIPAFVPAFLVNYVRSNWRNLIVFALIAAAVLGVYLKGRADNAKHERARDAIAVAAAVASDTRANDKAAATAVQDARIRVEKEKELTDEVANVPDTVPDAVAVRLGCGRLRQAGVSVADLPACRAAGG